MPREYSTFNPLGVILDIPPENIPPDKFSFAENVDFSDQASMRAKGSLDISGPTAVRAVSTKWIDVDGGDYWVYASGEGVGVWTSSAHQDITPADWTPGLDNGLVFSILNGIVILNYAGVGAWYWDPQTFPGPMLPLPDFATAVGSASSVRPFKNFLIALGVSGTPDRVYWSDAAAPGTVPSTWTPAPDNLAGDFTLSDTEGGVVDGLQLRNDFVIYKNNATYLMQFTGGQFVMTQRLLFKSTGVLTWNCVAEWQGRHLCLCDGDIVAHDGVTVQSVADQQIRRYLFANLSTDFYRRSFVLHNDESKEFVVGVPSVSSQGYCDFAFVWDYTLNAWAIRRFPIEIGGAGLGRYLTPGGDELEWDNDTGQWDLDSSSWGSTGQSATQDRVVGAIPNAGPGTFLAGLVEDVDDFLGQPIRAKLVGAAFNFNDNSTIKMLHRIWPEMSANAATTVRFRVGAQFDHGSPPRFSAWKDFDVRDGDKLDFEVQGRYLTIELESTGGPPWELHGLTIEWDRAGRF